MSRRTRACAVHRLNVQYACLKSAASTVCAASARARAHERQRGLAMATTTPTTTTTTTKTTTTTRSGTSTSPCFVLCALCASALCIFVHDRPRSFALEIRRRPRFIFANCAVAARSPPARPPACLLACLLARSLAARPPAYARRPPACLAARLAVRRSASVPRKTRSPVNLAVEALGLVARVCASARAHLPPDARRRSRRKRSRPFHRRQSAIAFAHFEARAFFLTSLVDIRGNRVTRFGCCALRARSQTLFDASPSRQARAFIV